MSVVGDHGRGIYLREPYEVRRLVKATAVVEPRFSEETGMAFLNACITYIRIYCLFVCIYVHINSLYIYTIAY